VREGDSGAFGEIYRRYHDELLFAVRAHLGPKLRTALESEDILQSVVIDAFRALPRFEPRGPGSLKHYLHAMIVNKIRSRAEYHGAARRSGTVPLTPEAEPMIPEPSSAPEYSAGERFLDLERALRALPAEMERVLILRKVDGLPSKEVAQVLGKSDASVRQIYSRALARLALSMGGSSAGGTE
jgi:RNA polymerase sigma-70 factor (ECF subfamily)